MDYDKRPQKELKLALLRSTILNIAHSHLPFRPLFFDEGYLKVESEKEGGEVVTSVKEALKAAQNEIGTFLETEEELANAAMSAQKPQNGAEITQEDFAGLAKFAAELLWEEAQSYRLVKDAFLGVQLAKLRDYHDDKSQQQPVHGRHLLCFYDSLMADSYARKFVYFIESIQRVRNQEKIKNRALLHQDLFRPTDIPDAYEIIRFTRDKDKPFAVHPNSALPPDKAEKGLHTIVSNLISASPDEVHWVQLARGMSDAAVHDNIAYFIENSVGLGGDVRLVLYSTSNQDCLFSSEFNKNVTAYTVAIRKALAMRRRAQDVFL